MKTLIATIAVIATTATAGFAAPRDIALSDVDLGSYGDVHGMDTFLELARSPMGVAEGINEDDYEFMMVFMNDDGDMLYAPSSRKGAVKFKPTLNSKGRGNFDLAGTRKWDTMDNVIRGAARAGFSLVGTVDRPNK